MSEETFDPAISALEERSRALFQDSVADLDMPTRSRLTQARHTALAAADASARRPWLMRTPVWASTAGITAAAVLGVALWFGGPLGHHGQLPTADAQSKFEDLDIVASSDESSGDAMDMLQDDIDFYDWADKTASSEPTA
jgi:negative regulator of sigma E activity